MIKVTNKDLGKMEVLIRVFKEANTCADTMAKMNKVLDVLADEIEIIIRKYKIG